jgi:hypothetical protein
VLTSDEVLETSISPYRRERSPRILRARSGLQGAGGYAFGEPFLKDDVDDEGGSLRDYESREVEAEVALMLRISRALRRWRKSAIVAPNRMKYNGPAIVLVARTVGR